jgi:malate dehydrogenase (oxaloacetate-decarboxylating)
MSNASVIAVRREIQMTSKVLVKDLMSTNVNVFENESTVDQVVQAMSNCDVDYVIVVQSKKPTGIITERDVIVRMLTQGLDPSVVIARAIYTNPLVTIEETETVEEAAKLMKEWNIKHLPVTREGRIAGMLNYLDIAFNVPELLSAMKELYKP